jgi:hypothetical protein
MAECCGVNSPNYVSPCACGNLERDKKNYYIECPFLDPRDNVVPLDVCKRCYWNNGIIIVGLNARPTQVSCKYMLSNDFPVQVMEYDKS